MKKSREGKQGTPNWSVTHHGRNIHCVEMVAQSTTDEWLFLLSGDRHHDNPHADHALERKHLDEVVKRNAGWIDVERFRHTCEEVSVVACKGWRFVTPCVGLWCGDVGAADADLHAIPTRAGAQGREVRPPAISPMG